jgi:asparagine synthase (glutamine-hydrolysing)
VLTGEGADEMLAGYDIFKEAKIRRFCARYPESRLRPLLFRRLYPYLPGLQAQSGAYRQAFFHASPGDEANPLFSHLPRWESTARLKLFFSEDVRNAVGDYDCFADLVKELPEAFGGWNWLNRAQHLEASYLMPGYILSSQGDRMAMAHSVEGRFPFLDHRVAEFAASLPARMKMKVLQEKHLLKTCARGLAPQVTVSRTKQPYRAPEAESLINTEYARELLSPERVRRDGVFQPEAVARLTAKLRQGRTAGMRDNMALVGILSTQILIEQFIHYGYRHS